MAKSKEFLAGNCRICNQEHRSTNGGWIINMEKKLFCYDTCFDLYLHNNKIQRDYLRELCYPSNR